MSLYHSALNRGLGGLCYAIVPFIATFENSGINDLPLKEVQVGIGELELLVWLRRLLKNHHDQKKKKKKKQM